MSAPVASGRSALEASPGTPADEGGLDIVASVTDLLTVTARTARLITLELRVESRPELAILARGTATAADLVAWSVRVRPAQWHAGFVLVATAHRGDQVQRAAVDGAASLLDDLLRAQGRRAQAEQHAAQAQRTAGVDRVTGLGNRLTWERAVAAESARAARYGRPSLVVVLELDDLHGIDDRQMQQAAAALSSAARTVDTLCRLRRCEYALLCPETGVDSASSVRSRLVSALATVGLQASSGVATAQDGDIERAWKWAELGMLEDRRRRGARRGTLA